MFMWTFLLRITHTIISQSIADSPWITLYMPNKPQTKAGESAKPCAIKCTSPSPEWERERGGGEGRGERETTGTRCTKEASAYSTVKWCSLFYNLWDEPEYLAASYINYQQAVILKWIFSLMSQLTHGCSQLLVSAQYITKKENKTIA